MRLNNPYKYYLYSQKLFGVVKNTPLSENCEMRKYSNDKILKTNVNFQDRLIFSHSLKPSLNMYENFMKLRLLIGNLDFMLLIS